MTDLALAWNNRLGAGDICVVGADLQAEDGLDTAILVSLFTDARVREDELPPGHTWRRGWWGDGVDDEPDTTGSKLWVLRRSKATQEGSGTRARLHPRGACVDDPGRRGGVAECVHQLFGAGRDADIHRGRATRPDATGIPVH